MNNEAYPDDTEFEATFRDGSEYDAYDKREANAVKIQQRAAFLVDWTLETKTYPLSTRLTIYIAADACWKSARTRCYIPKPRLP